MFCEELSGLLSAKGLTVKRAAELVGVPYRTMQNWLYGVNTPCRMVREQVLKVLGAE